MSPGPLILPTSSCSLSNSSTQLCLSTWGRAAATDDVDAALGKYGDWDCEAGRVSAGGAGGAGGTGGAGGVAAQIGAATQGASWRSNALEERQQRLRLAQTQMTRAAPPPPAPPDALPALPAPPGAPPAPLTLDTSAADQGLAADEEGREKLGSTQMREALWRAHAELAEGSSSVAGAPFRCGGFNAWCAAHNEPPSPHAARRPPPAPAL